MAYRHLARPGWPSTLDAALQCHSYRVAITQVARNLHRAPWQPSQPHTLPRLPAPPTPAEQPLKGPARYGRSERSLADRPQTELSAWRGSSPKNMMPGSPAIKRVYFDHKKAAAHDVDN